MAFDTLAWDSWVLDSGIFIGNTIYLGYILDIFLSALVYVSFGIFPGLFDRIHGLLFQNSSLMMSRCSTTILALALLFLSFSACVLDCSTGPAWASTDSAVL